MTKIFLTKVWGYDPPTWPILGFGTQGGVNKLQSEYSTGDWIVLVGTKGEPTAEEDRGRLLGKIQITNTVVELEPVLKSLRAQLRSNAYKDNGEFRWPHGFPYLTAMSFVKKPLLSETLPERGGQHARAEAAYAIQLSEEEAKAIQSLSTEEVNFPIAPVLNQDLKLKSLLTQSGPPPSAGERSSVYADGDNSVYVFRIRGTNFYKIGRSNDIQRRLNEFNTSPHAIWSEKPFDIVNSHPFSDAESAHEVEQMLHKHLEQYGVGFECFVVPKEAVVVAALGNMVYEYSRKAIEM